MMIKQNNIGVMLTQMNLELKTDNRGFKRKIASSKFLSCSVKL